MITGDELNEMSDQQLQKKIKSTTIFARVILNKNCASLKH